jgi:hypothetical protein
MAKHEMEIAAEAQGISISDTPDFLNEPQDAPAPSPEPEPSEPQATQPVAEEAPEPVQEAPEPAPQPEPETQEVVFKQQYTEPQAQPTQPVERQTIDEDSIALQKLSERLNMKFDSFDQVSEQFNRQADIDPRVAAINEFVTETGRSVDDWYKYQTLDTSEMDDQKAVRMQMEMDFPKLTSAEIDTLMKNKYKLDSERHTEEEVATSSVELKMQAEKARQSIEEIREAFRTPDPSQATEDEFMSPIDDQWVASMSKEVDNLDGISFDLPTGKTFTYGLADQYKDTLKEKNAKLESFFDSYVSDDGKWDYDLLNSHRAVTDNIDQIVSAVYRQGMSDGQRRVVQNAANVRPATPQAQKVDNNAEAQRNKIIDQLAGALGGDKGMTFNF